MTERHLPGPFTVLAVTITSYGNPFTALPDIAGEIYLSFTCEKGLE